MLISEKNLNDRQKILYCLLNSLKQYDDLCKKTPELNDDVAFFQSFLNGFFESLNSYLTSLSSCNIGYNPIKFAEIQIRDMCLINSFELEGLYQILIELDKKAYNHENTGISDYYKKICTGHVGLAISDLSQGLELIETDYQPLLFKFHNLKHENRLSEENLLVILDIALCEYNQEAHRAQEKKEREALIEHIMENVFTLSMLDINDLNSILVNFQSERIKSLENCIIRLKTKNMAKLFNQYIDKSHRQESFSEHDIFKLLTLGLLIGNKGEDQNALLYFEFGFSLCRLHFTDEMPLVKILLKNYLIARKEVSKNMEANDTSLITQIPLYNHFIKHSNDCKMIETRCLLKLSALIDGMISDLTKKETNEQIGFFPIQVTDSDVLAKIQSIFNKHAHRLNECINIINCLDNSTSSHDTLINFVIKLHSILPATLTQHAEMLGLIETSIISQIEKMKIENTQLALKP